MHKYTSCIFFVILITFHTSYAYSTFDPQCAFPNSTVSLVHGPEIRSSFNILWSCLFTLFVCLWNVHNLNVPEQKDHRCSTRWGHLKWNLKATWRQVKWMVTTLIAPEFILALAIHRLDLVFQIHKKLEELAHQQGVTWTETHTIFANMGGFVLRNRESMSGPTGPSNCHEERGLSANQVYQQQIDNMDPTSVEKSANTSLSPPQVVVFPYHLTAQSIVTLCQSGHLQLPNLPKHSIEDLSKSNIFTKSISILQLLWSFVTVISRWKQDLAVTQLEMTTIAFTLFALIIYSRYWKFPLDVQIPITFHELTSANPRDMDLLQELTSNQSRNPNMGKAPRNFDRYTLHTSSFSGSLLFGGLSWTVFLIPWTFSFPYWQERLAWRYCAVYCVSFGAVWAALHYRHLQRMRQIQAKKLTIAEESSAPKYLFILVLVPMIFVYVLARLFLIVESFRLLAFQPPSAFQATWAINWPGFG